MLARIASASEPWSGSTTSAHESLIHCLPPEIFQLAVCRKNLINGRILFQDPKNRVRAAPVAIFYLLDESGKLLNRVVLGPAPLDELPGRKALEK